MVWRISTGMMERLRNKYYWTNLCYEHTQRLIICRPCKCLTFKRYLWREDSFVRFFFRVMSWRKWNYEKNWEQVGTAEWTFWIENFKLKNWVRFFVPLVLRRRIIENLSREEEGGAEPDVVVGRFTGSIKTLLKTKEKKGQLGSFE